jgi:hypothetical protein
VVKAKKQKNEEGGESEETGRAGTAGKAMKAGRVEALLQVALVFPCSTTTMSGHRHRLAVSYTSSEGAHCCRGRHWGMIASETFLLKDPSLHLGGGTAQDIERSLCESGRY